MNLDGELTLHGTTNPLKTESKIIIKNGVIEAATKFNVLLEAFKIKVEESYKDRINDLIKLYVKFNYNPM